MAKALGIDYGEKRVGIAISDESMKIAFRAEPIVLKKNVVLLEELKKLIDEYEIERIILGLPLGLNEKPTQMSEKIRKFSDALQKRCRVDIILWNEVFTSNIAARNLRKIGGDKSIDSEAARIILQEYLDHQNS